MSCTYVSVWSVFIRSAITPIYCAAITDGEFLLYINGRQIKKGLPLLDGGAKYVFFVPKTFNPLTCGWRVFSCLQWNVCSKNIYNWTRSEIGKKKSSTTTAVCARLWRDYFPEKYKRYVSTTLQPYTQYLTFF